MTRPCDWSPLADSDPVPGDPFKVGELSRRYRETASTISGQAVALRELCTDDYWDSDAGREFRSKSDSLAGKLEDAFARYDAAATALSGYQPELEEAQRLADAALATAQEAVRVHEQQVEAAQRVGPPTGTADEPVVTAAVPPVPAEPDLGPARTQLAEAVRVRDEAARAAAAAIGRVIDHDDVHDSWGDRFKGWVHDHAGLLGAISTWAARVSVVCGGLSLLVGWIPIVGQAAATVLGTIAFAATAVSLVCDLTLALAGEGSWLGVGIDVVGLLSFGIGRAAVSGGAEAARGVRGIASETVLTAGRRAGRLPTGRQLNRLFLRAKWGSVGLTPREAELARSSIPTGRIAGIRPVLFGLNPFSVVRDIREGVVSAATDFRIWRRGGFGEQGLTWPKPWRGDVGLANEISLARTSLSRVPEIGSRGSQLISQAVGAQRTWFAANVAGIVPTGVDLLGGFNDLKPALTAGVPLP